MLKMVYAKEDFDHDFYQHGLDEPVKRIEDIIDEHLQYMAKHVASLDNVSCTFGIREERSDLSYEKLDIKLTNDAVAKRIAEDGYLIKSILLLHHASKRTLIKSRVVDDYRNAGWHVAWTNRRLLINR